MKLCGDKKKYVDSNFHNKEMGVLSSILILKVKQSITLLQLIFAH